ncbi:hypothetical protein B0O99DRAFT_202416 [Bisporella sp. PMI_857]|nr:hypothetical protein B0O99DRAFT_202416 [Bisporella sp. PMI_857]
MSISISQNLAAHLNSTANYYAILGTTYLDFSPEKLTYLFRRGLVKYHADKAGSAYSQETYKLSGMAYEILKNPVLKDVYDMNWKKRQREEIARLNGASKDKRSYSERRPREKRGWEKARQASAEFERARSGNKAEERARELEERLERAERAKVEDKSRGDLRSRYYWDRYPDASPSYQPNGSWNAPPSSYVSPSKKPGVPLDAPSGADEVHHIPPPRAPEDEMTVVLNVRLSKKESGCAWKRVFRLGYLGGHKLVVESTGATEHGWERRYSGLGRRKGESTRGDVIVRVHVLD